MIQIALLLTGNPSKFSSITPSNVSNVMMTHFSLPWIKNIVLNSVPRAKHLKKKRYFKMDNSRQDPFANSAHIYTQRIACNAVQILYQMDLIGALSHVPAIA